MSLYVARLVKGLTEPQRKALAEADVLVDGRILVPAYAVPDSMTRTYSVHRSELNRHGVAAREIVLGDRRG